MSGWFAVIIPGSGSSISPAQQRAEPPTQQRSETLAPASLVGIICTRLGGAGPRTMCGHQELRRQDQAPGAPWSTWGEGCPPQRGGAGSRCWLRSSGLACLRFGPGTHICSVDDRRWPELQLRWENKNRLPYRSRALGGPQ